MSWQLEALRSFLDESAAARAQLARTVRAEVADDPSSYDDLAALGDVAFNDVERLGLLLLTLSLRDRLSLVGDHAREVTAARADRVLDGLAEGVEDRNVDAEADDHLAMLQLQAVVSKYTQIQALASNLLKRFECLTQGIVSKIG